MSDNISTDSKISTALSSKITGASANEEIPVIIMLTDQKIAFNSINGKSQIEREQKNIINILENARSDNSAKNIKPIKIINAVAAKVTPEVIASLVKMPEVSVIEPDEVVHIAESQELPLNKIKALSSMLDATNVNAWGVDKIGAPAVWQQGVTGKGIIVAVVDTGIDVQHPDLDDLDDNPNTNDPKVVGWIDYINGENSPYDDNYHGTHVAGTISGTGANGMHTGVAPGTKLIGAKVFDSQCNGWMSDIILGFEWAVNNDARIINFLVGLHHMGMH